MSQIHFLEVGLKNYGSFKELVFPISTGKHLVLGENKSSNSANSNGAGKSTVFESIPVCLYKALLRGKDPSHQWAGNCMHWVKFRKGTDEYRIERYWGWKASVEFNPRLFKNEEEISCRKSADTEKAIEELLGISYDLFISTIVVLQGLPMNFGTMKPTERKGIVEQLLGFNIWEDIRSEFQSSIESRNLTHAQAVEEFQKVKESLAQTNGKLEAANRIVDVQSDKLQEEIIDLKGHLKKLQGKRALLEEQLEEILQGEGYQSVQTQYSEMSRASVDLRRRAEELRSAIHNATCTACGQNLPESIIQTSKNQLQKVEGKLEAVSEMYKELSSKLDQARELIGSKNRLDEEAKFKSYEIQKATSALTSTEQSVDTEKLQSELEELLESANASREVLADVTKELDHLKFIDKLLLPSSEFRSKVLEKYLTYINSILDSILPLLLDKTKCQLIVTDNGKGLDVEISRGNKVSDYKSFSGGEKRRIDVALLLTFQKFLMESAGVSSNLLVWDEIFDSLDDQGIVGVIDCIGQLFPDSSAIYVITHNITVKSQFDSVIKVVKENDVSTLDSVMES